LGSAPTPHTRATAQAKPPREPNLGGFFQSRSSLSPRVTLSSHPNHIPSSSCKVKPVIITIRSSSIPDPFSPRAIFKTFNSPSSRNVLGVSLELFTPRALFHFPISNTFIFHIKHNPKTGDLLISILFCVTFCLLERFLCSTFAFDFKFKQKDQIFVRHHRI
jgi:hypothetical protein